MSRNWVSWVKFTSTLASIIVIVPAFSQPPDIDLPSEITKDASVDSLVQDLRDGWDYIETGKGWIPEYSIEMVRLSQHGEIAVAPLVELALDRNASVHARHGAVLAIHLIGVKGRIALQPNETFVSRAARQSLLTLLDEPEFQVLILQLLIRDPWKSDVPVLVAKLEPNSPNDWAFVKALQCYKVKESPVHQALPDDIARRPCSIRWLNENDFLKVSLSALLEIGGPQVVFDPQLSTEQVWGTSRSKTGMVNDDFRAVLEKLTGCEFGDLGKRVEYYVEDGVIHVCTIKTAKLRWLNWSKKQMGPDGVAKER